jgi:hypothetical protein
VQWHDLGAAGTRKHPAAIADDGGCGLLPIQVDRPFVVSSPALMLAFACFELLREQPRSLFAVATKHIAVSNRAVLPRDLMS